MKERPIIMSAGNVKAILEGRKTQTRRVIKGTLWLERWSQEAERLGVDLRSTLVANAVLKCPYGQVGDRLWVKETFSNLGSSKPTSNTFPIVFYKATIDEEIKDAEPEDADILRDIKWTPAIFMPRWASRILLEITEVRAEKLLEITDEDIQAEGEPYMPLPEGKLLNFGYTKPYNYIREHFAWYWDSLNAKRGYGWDKNPFVWAISYIRIKE